MTAIVSRAGRRRRSRVLPRLAGLVAGVLAGAALSGGALGAAAYDVGANCQVVPVAFVFDGAPVRPQVANGNPGAFICDGTSYVPLRFMAQQLGRQVSWDGSTDTITVATPSGTPAGTAPVTVQAAAAGSLGQILVDGSGRTLYRFAQDSSGTSNCNTACTAPWPPLAPPATGQPVLAPGVPGTLGVITRQDGRQQVTYDGIPLYRFTGDSEPGQTNGQNRLGVWFTVTPAATAAGATATAPAGGTGGS